MSCANCGNAVQMDQDRSDNTTELGAEFSEYYECFHCGGTGRIDGTVGQPPKNWNKTGVVFNA